jgi:hypothetical protein
LPVLDRKRTKLQQSRLFGMQLQMELPHSLAELRPKLFGIRFPLESNYAVIGKPHDYYISMGSLPAPRLDPQVEYVMKIDVRQKRRGTATLGRPFFHSYPFPILQHAGVQPFSDEPRRVGPRSGAR